MWQEKLNLCFLRVMSQEFILISHLTSIYYLMCVQYMGDPLKTVGVNSSCKFMMDYKAIVRCIFAPNIVA